MTLKRKKIEMAKKKPMLEKASRLMVEDFEPRTQNQENCVISIAENVVTIITGPSGSGKTAISCGMASSYLCDGKVEKIFITRPMVQASKGNNTLGALKGDLDEKFLPYMTPLIEELERFLGKETFRKYIMQEIIQIVPIELCRGRNLANTFIIVDESQNCTYEQIVLMLTRIDKGSKFVMIGDTKQSDIKGGGFAEVINKIKNVKDLGICLLDINDIQRHEIVGNILRALEE
jgi:phosphate starvation-inducible PhoH-like protein